MQYKQLLARFDAFHKEKALTLDQFRRLDAASAALARIIEDLTRQNETERPNEERREIIARLTADLDRGKRARKVLYAQYERSEKAIEELRRDLDGVMGVPRWAAEHDRVCQKGGQGK